MKFATRLEPGDLAGVVAALLACLLVAATSLWVRSTCAGAFGGFGTALPEPTQVLCDYWWTNVIAALVAAVPAAVGVSIDAPLPLRRMLIVTSYVSALVFIAITAWVMYLPFHSLL